MAIAALLLAGGAQAGELKLAFYGQGLAGSRIRVAVYSAAAAEQFPSEEKFYRGLTVEATGEPANATVPDLPPGTYAVAAYVDSNRNGRKDKNFLGMPSEAYGFSNDARGMFGPPAFAAAAFEVGEAPAAQSIHLH